jgi:exopolyphosphatase/guanosine-5'-triphosphate,3'-diphosphate pyrophosphatase
MRIAALDLGSNSFHLIVAEVAPDQSFVPLVREKEMLRLGSVVIREGRITAEAADRAVRTARRMRLLAEAAGATELVAAATSALRAAPNGPAVLERIEAEAGVTAQVIDGLEEARLIFGAVRAAVVLDPGPALCLDVGGGSVELMVGDAAGLRWAASERLGVARLATLVHDDPPSKADRRRLRDRVRAGLAPHVPTVEALGPKMTVGSSGTLETLALMATLRAGRPRPRSLNQLTVPAAALAELAEELVRSDAEARRRMDGLDERRVDLIVPGAVLLDTALELFGADELVISEWALREGLLLEAIGRHDPADWSEDPRAIRRASVVALARRCSWPEAHSRHVAGLAVSLFDQTAGLHGLGETDRELLEAAALLHDIGEHIDHEDHDRHAAYLVGHGRLRGFTPEEVRVLAGVVRWHRRGEPKADDPLVGPLEGPARERVRRLAALLRVADGLDRGRRQVVTGLRARVDPSLVLVRVSAAGDPELELWGARRKRDLFERVFARELEVTCHPAARFAPAPAGVARDEPRPAGAT